MTDTVNLTPIKDKLAQKGSIFVLFGSHATVDHVAASLGLFLALKQAGHDVTISSPAELRVEYSRLVGLNQIAKTIGNRNLVISLGDYDPANIDKVATNEGKSGHFELIVQPKSGAKAPDPKQIEFSFRGAAADMIFLVGVTRLEDLGDFYQAERTLFREATTVSFNRRQNPDYASISIVDLAASSLSEIVAEFIFELGLTLEADVASNLLAGIDYATNRFQNPQISAQAFLTAGKLVQMGAKRQPPRITSAVQMPGFSPGSPFPSFMTNPQTPPIAPGQQTFAPAFNPDQPTPQTPQPQPTPKPVTPLPSLTPPARKQGNQPNQPQKSDSAKQPPKDWLEPKIYKGGSRV